jgi:hypothetical protein
VIFPLTTEILPALNPSVPLMVVVGVAAWAKMPPHTTAASKNKSTIFFIAPPHKMFQANGLFY